MRVSNKLKLTNKRQDESDADADADAGGLKMEGWIRLASVHFASTEHNPPIPLG